MHNPWPHTAKLPSGPRAVLAALHMSDPHPEALDRLTEREWRQAADFSYRSQLMLSLRGRMRERLPEWLRERTDEDAAKNGRRVAEIEALYRTLDETLAASGIPYLAIKGLTQIPEFIAKSEDRVQYDIDLFTPREHVQAAQSAVRSLGFESLEDMDRFPTDHVPALIRKTGWEWRGDFFDPEMPLAVELHFRFWNGELERLPIPDPELFWERRTSRVVAGRQMGTLCRPDALGYTSLHLLKHILRGSGRPFHVYELASFLNSHTADIEFWNEWSSLHSPEFRRLQAVVFRLAEEWFGCGLAPAAREETERLPAATKAWFEEFATAPARRLFETSKDELWLHVSLMPGRADAWAVARRRLFPGKLPGPVDAIYIPESEMKWHRQALKGARYSAYVAQRLRHHAAALPNVAVSGLRWWWKTNALGKQFWIFLAAAVLYNFALFIFVLLYNLHLLDLGFREDFLGVVSSASTVGAVVGTLPAAAVARRFGLRNTLVGAIAGMAAVTALRAIATGRPILTGLAFLNGLVFSVWAILMAPTIAGAVEDDRRPAAFSVFFATMFSLGIGGGWLGGRLPLWVHGKQMALLCAAGIVALAIWPAMLLKPHKFDGSAAKTYPRGPFLWRYLLPFAIWHAATGSFNPFFNAYFARLRFPVERIGMVFSASQFTQVITVLLAPVVFRRAGLIKGIVGMMSATALGLAALAVQPPGAAAALAYAAYMAFQWMSEPGLNTLLMNNVEERERSGASALNYFVAFGAQALAALAAGTLVTRFGYGPVLAGATALAISAAALFQLLLANRFNTQHSGTRR